MRVDTLRCPALDAHDYFLSVQIGERSWADCKLLKRDVWFDAISDAGRPAHTAIHPGTLSGRASSGGSANSTSSLILPTISTSG